MIKKKEIKERFQFRLKRSTREKLDEIAKRYSTKAGKYSASGILEELILEEYKRK